MRVRFQNTLEDLQAEQDVLREYYRQTPESPHQNRLGVFLILGVLIGLLCISQQPGDVLLLIAPVTAAVVFIVGLTRLAGRLVVQQRYDELVAGYPTEIERYSDGLEWSSGGLRTFTPASNLGEILEARNRLFVLWKHSSPQRPHCLLIIPQNAFVSPEDFDAFRQSLEDLRDQPAAPDRSTGLTEDPGVCSLTTCNTIDESLQAMRIAAGLCPLWRRYVLAVGGWCLLFVAIGLLLLAVSPHFSGRILSGLLVLLPPLVFWKLRQARTGMTREQLEAAWPREHLENPYHWTITPAGLQVAILHSWTLLPWDRIRTWVETDVGLVIVQAGDLVHFVPRSAADTADEWSTFVETFHRWAPAPRPM